MADIKYTESTPKPKTMDELYQEYVDSLHLIMPQPSDYNLTEEIIEQVENKSFATDNTAHNIEQLVLNNQLEKECEKKIYQIYNRFKIYDQFKIFDETLSIYIYGFIISLLFFIIWFSINSPFDDIWESIFCCIIFSLFCCPLGVILLMMLMSAVEYVAKKIYVRKHLQKRIEKELENSLFGIISGTAKEMNYNKYMVALKEYQYEINNLKILIPWSDVNFKDGEISCFIQLFKRTFTWNIPRSLSIYDKYRLLLMDKFPDLYFKYVDGHLRLFTDSVDTAINIIIEYIDRETAERKAKEEREKREKERKELEEQERKEREREEREKERREKEKLMNDFYSSHPYFKNEHDKQDALRTKIKVEKSKYLNYLMEHQVDGIDIMSVKEDRRAASMMYWQIAEVQSGYIFVLKMNAAEYCLVYENVFDNNASIKYINSSLLACLEAAMDIKIHMQSKTPNKRDKIASTRKIGEHRVRRIMHDDFYDWKQKLHSRTFR